MPTNEDGELLQAFLEEAREHLDGIEGNLLLLESSATPDIELVNQIFRAIHSVKGAAGFFGLESIKSLSHAMESILGLMQKGTLLPSSAIIGALLGAADVLIEMIHDPQIDAGRDVTELIQKLESAVLIPAHTVAKARADGDSGSSSSTFEPPAPLSVEAGMTDTAEVKLFPGTPSVDAGSGDFGSSVSTTPELVVVSKAQAAHAPSHADSSIRVHIGILDRLMSLAGELVLTRNQLLQSFESNATRNAEATQRIDHITTELQDAIMLTRMQSIGNVFQRFRRVVRDLASALGKEVDLEIQGEEVELDRSIVEAIVDPLTHLVRNALDHGIEKPDARQAGGKLRRGTLRLSALHKAGQVVIEIADDGAGIDPVRVKTKALEKGICSAEQLAAMSESAVIRLIFRPGFSTAAQVTEVSGRGVGMDVVHSNLAKLGGVVDVQSTVGAGTLMRIKLPLTLAIIPCLLVAEEGESFAIPQASLIELHRIPARETKHRIKSFGDVLVLRLRGELIPLMRLRDALSLQHESFMSQDDSRIVDRRQTGYDRRQEDYENEQDRRAAGDRRVSHRSAVNIAIVGAGDFRYGIMVEQLLDSLEIVVKPLGRHLRHCDSYAGATILGDGRVALILDVVSIGRRLQASEKNEALISAKLAGQKVVEHHDQMTLLLVESSGSELMAIPLGLIERIERLNAGDIQLVGGRRTLTYRGRNLPLLTIDEVVQVAPCREVERLFAVVFRAAQREIGVLVSDLVNIVDSNTELDELTHRQSGVFGSLLVDGRVTLLLDVHGIAQQRLGLHSQTAAATPAKKYTVLVVDDSRFFRDRITEFCRDAGYEVLTGEDGLDGFKTLAANADKVDLVITDIEMPNLNGFEFTSRIRADLRFKKLPVLAVTSLMGEEAEQRGRQVGITEYMIKLDRDRTMERVAHYLGGNKYSNPWSTS